MSTRILAILGVIVLALGLVASSAIYTVQQTQQALVLQFGEIVATVREPGLKYKTPFVQNVVFLDNRILAFDAPAEEIIASDQKRLVVDSFIRFRISEPEVFYKAVGTENIARSRLGTILNSSLRRVLGSVPLNAVLTGERAGLMVQIRDFVNAQAKNLGVEVVDVRIKRTDLPEANNQAIYALMNTERQREAREYRAQGFEAAQRIKARADREKTVLLAEAEKKSETLRGEGDGKATKIFADAFGKDIEFFTFYRSMQAYRKTLGADDTTMVLSPNSEFFRYFGNISGILPDSR
jgi:membrane protease subunit HflC